MEIEGLLRDLIKGEEIKMKKYVLFMLLKFSHCVKHIENESDYLPLLLIKNNQITLVYKEDEVDEMKYIFTDYEEILIVLQKVFNDNKTIYFHFEPVEEQLHVDEILQKIDEAILADDKELFYHFSAKLLK